VKAAGNYRQEAAGANGAAGTNAAEPAGRRGVIGPEIAMAQAQAKLKNEKNGHNGDHGQNAGGTVVKETAKAVERQSRKIADSAEEMKESSAQIESSADRATRLAADRTILAAERTYASWVRTGLFALASGIGARALLNGVLPGWIIRADASMLVLFSTFCFGAAIWRHSNPGPPPPTPNVQQIPQPLLVIVNAFLGLVSLAALVGIWVAR
jgi:putative membrane protein